MNPAPGYYRHPTIHGDVVVFVCEDDLWTVSVHGGPARRLTASPGVSSFPVLSPDGAQIAFTAQDEGPAEAFVMDAEGGPARRLTWFGATTRTLAWTRDGASVVVASDWGRPFRGNVHLHAVREGGGAPVALRHGPAQAVSFRPDGAGVVIGRNSGDPARWKRYRGGTAGTVWIDRNGSGAFTPLVKVRGNLANPMWIGKRIWFLSDHEGHGNLYSCTTAGKDLRRHTHHEDFYVRFPSSDGRRIVYHAGGDLWLFDPEGGTARRIDVRLASPRSQRARKFVSAAEYLETFALHPDGHSVVCVVRGTAHSMGNWDGAPARHADKPGSRVRLATWMPDGRRIAAVSDATGEEGIVVFPAAPQGESTAAAPAPAAQTPGAPVRVAGDIGRAIELAVAPAGADRIAITNHRNELVLADLAAGTVRVVERSEFDRIAGLAWSADGRWLAYGFPASRRTCCLHLLDTVSGKVSQITRPEFRDGQPSFDPEGRFLHFISWRVFDPVYDSQTFDLGFPRGSRPYLLTLRAATPSPFSAAHRAPRGPSAPGGGPPAAPAHDAPDAATTAPAAPAPAASGPAPVEIDLEGIEDRVVAFPVPEGRYGRVIGARGQALLLSFPADGALSDNWAPTLEPPAKGTLQAWDFDGEKLTTVTSHVSDAAASMRGGALAVRSGNRVRVVGLSAPATELPARDDRGRESGWIDLGRLRAAVVPSDEWRQMFRESWRLQRDHFWSSDMAGIGWQAVHDRYLPLVERVASRADFSDLVWEMQGELNTSHCYEFGGDHRPTPAWPQGHLGADIVLEGGTWRVARVPHGDGWDVDASSPLAAPGVGVRAGDEILEVAGDPVGPVVSPFERLAHAAGADIALTVRRAGAVRRVVVRTLRDERALRYRDWVETNRARVHAATKGRVGYLHVPDMGPVGFAEFFRHFPVEVDRDGLVVDVRWNGGGHVSQLLIEKLLRSRTAYCAPRWQRPESYPSDAPMGPIVCITNEYAGSDGDIFSHTFKIHRLGPLIGKRTWGGVVGIWPRHVLADGTVTTQPEFAWWFRDVGWSVENHGTDPDIEVEIRPQDHAAGRDPQLDRALTEMRKILAKVKPRVPELKNPPRLAPPRLPS